MSDEGATIGAIAAILSAVGTAAGAGASIYSATRSTPKPPSMPTPTAADRAALGAMRSDMFGGVTPSFRAGLQGAPTGPIPGAGGATTGSIVGANDYSTVLARMLGGSGGGELGSGSGIGG